MTCLPSPIQTWKIRAGHQGTRDGLEHAPVGDLAGEDRRRLLGDEPLQHRVDAVGGDHHVGLGHGSVFEGHPGLPGAWRGPWVLLERDGPVPRVNVAVGHGTAEHVHEVRPVHAVHRRPAGRVRGHDRRDPGAVVAVVGRSLAHPAADLVDGRGQARAGAAGARCSARSARPPRSRRSRAPARRPRPQCPLWSARRPPRARRFRRPLPPPSARCPSAPAHQHCPSALPFSTAISTGALLHRRICPEKPRRFIRAANYLTGNRFSPGRARLAAAVLARAAGGRRGREDGEGQTADQAAPNASTARGAERRRRPGQRR